MNVLRSFKLLRGDSELSVVLGLGVATLFAVALGGLFYTPPKDTSNQTATSATQPCILPADPSAAITFSGKQYVPLRRGVSFIKAEIRDHLALSPEVVTVDSVARQIYTVPDLISLTGWTDDARKMIFLNVDDTVPPQKKMNGFTYFDVYIEQGTATPSFVKEHCDLNTTESAKPIGQDTQGATNPPVSLNSDDITNWVNGTGDSVNDCYDVVLNGVVIGNRCSLKPPANTEYSLLAYDFKTTTTGKYNLSSKFPRGKYTITYNGEQKTFSVYYVSESIMYQLVLFDDDPDPGEENILYKYVPPSFASPTDEQLGIQENTSTARNSLQIGTFIPSQKGVEPWGWWNPECKPAVYLYPQKEMAVHVEVNPVGPLTYTDPVYPEGGWDVIADPNGNILSQNNQFDYLYYETKIPDMLLAEPASGYLVTYEALSDKLKDITTQLGLNAKEQKDLIDYWTPILPKAPYYQISLISRDQLDSLSSLTVSPTPDSTLRVMLYFIPRTEPIFLPEPRLSSFTRKGFTVVEWGGLYKQDKEHPFTCMM